MSHRRSMFVCAAVLIAAALVTSALAADAPPMPDAQTLGFEREPVNGRPGGWFGGPVETIVSDTATKRGGARSARLTRDAGSTGGFSFLGLGMPLELEGTIELRGWLKREGEGQASLWMRQDGAGGTSVAFVDMGAKPDVANEWTSYSISFAAKKEARQLVIGVRLVGAGTAWADDFELFVDGKPIAQAPRAAREQTIIDTDREFLAGSKIALTSLDRRQLDTLVLAGKVWGFLKYHHPAVTGGARHWDFELFRRLPKLLKARNARETRRLLVEWIDGLGAVPPCNPCLKADASWPVKPRVDWIDDAGLLGQELRARLRAIHASRRAGPQFYVQLARNVSNPLFENEPGYMEVKFPDAGMQMLAVLRFWNMVEYWFPYRDLIDEDWDGVLRDSLVRVVTARDADEYRREIAALVARVDDGHANATIDAAHPMAGECTVPLALSLVEGKFIVQGIASDTARDFRVGDEVRAIDGRPVDEIVAQLRRYQGASNETARLRGISHWLLNGACGAARVTVQREGTLEIATRRETIERSKLRDAARRDRAGDTLQWLSPKVAYLKLSSVRQAEVAKQIESIAAADALVVDIRNYPREFVVFALGALLVEESTPFAVFTTAQPGNPGAFDFGPAMRLQPAKARFDGRVAILVDDSSISQAEYTAMALRAPMAGARRKIIVGSQTAGADGNVSPIVLPGNVPAGFSGIGVFYPDRTPTQQRGVAIDVPCAPTIGGIRAGRDEVLECALRALEAVVPGEGGAGKGFVGVTH